ncbi:hypothetical protein IscW_ISCW007461 [Ixodes scapularis]|uniref:Uncharacterized protein n=1 Tax=Ixodes scapularis TaxID=6945 RepID=B7PSC8_IXOSC|nr:hypothetical protein IscW_ISCW007461 [Ixodes scapularis]|eukprot:XP_002402246.1 hypothetical protein IscW_ISCW007461 [Ixodes scapularis]
MRRRSSRGAGPERGLTQMSGEDPSAEGVFCSVRRAHTHAHLPMTSTRKWSAKRVTFPRDWRQKEPPRNSAAAAVGLRRGCEDGRSPLWTRSRCSDNRDRRTRSSQGQGRRRRSGGGRRRRLRSRGGPHEGARAAWMMLCSAATPSPTEGRPLSPAT